MLVGKTAMNALRRTQHQQWRTLTQAVDVQVEHNTTASLDSYEPGRFRIQTFNKISPKGLEKFPKSNYDVSVDGMAHAILMRSHKLKKEEVGHTVRAIARCGAGTNNIPVDEMTEIGIPVFNTPGANANAVKELVICGMLLGSRGIIDGINHMTELGKQGLARERVEKDKAMFGGRELQGKTLAVIGLGHIGSSTARDAANLGMSVTGYDPGLSVHSALQLPKTMQLRDSIQSAVKNADYISINIPYIKGENGTHGIINDSILNECSEDAVILNFARGELVDSESMKNFLDASPGRRYVSDFPDDVLWNHKQTILLPHLGASTEEAEENAAGMAAMTIQDFLETGTIRNSVNFPATSLPDRPADSVRFTIVNRNEPGVLARITDAFGSAGFNILQQINHSRNNIAYNVLDIATTEKLDLGPLQERITMTEGVVSSRVIFGTPGSGYAKNLGDGVYFV